MARLIAKPDGITEQVIDLKMGINRVGRSPANDFQIEHPTISATHCELSINDGELVISGEFTTRRPSWQAGGDELVVSRYHDRAFSPTIVIGELGPADRSAVVSAAGRHPAVKKAAQEHALSRSAP